MHQDAKFKLYSGISGITNNATIINMLDINMHSLDIFLKMHKYFYSIQ